MRSRCHRLTAVGSIADGQRKPAKRIGRIDARSRGGSTWSAHDDGGDHSGVGLGQWSVVVTVWMPVDARGSLRTSIIVPSREPLTRRREPGSAAGVSLQNAFLARISKMKSRFHIKTGAWH